MYKKVLIGFSLFMYMSAVLVVVLTAFIEGFENALKITTKENGFFESISALLLLLMGVYGIKWLFGHAQKINKFLAFLITLFSLLCILAFLEEISWGQHIFHFKSSEFFQLNNYQKESNLHNLIPASIFSSVIYFCVYTVFIFAPLILRLFEKPLSSKCKLITFLMPYLPPLHVSLMILFASSFQAYFYNDFGVWSDTITLICGVILFAFCALKCKVKNSSIWYHFLFVVFSISLFMFCHKIFNYFNAQYEIREMFVVLGSFIYFEFLLGEFEKMTL